MERVDLPADRLRFIRSEMRIFRQSAVRRHVAHQGRFARHEGLLRMADPECGLDTLQFGRRKGEAFLRDMEPPPGRDEVIREWEPIGIFSSLVE